MKVKLENHSPFTRRLKDARVKSKLSQKSLGILAGIDEFSASSRMNQYEKGRHTPDFAIVKHLAEVMGVPTSYLYEENDEIALLLVKFYKLTDKEKKIIHVLIDELLSK